jgi:hypothetical protein
MTVREAIEKADALRKNHPLEDETMQQWLRQADGYIRRDVIARSEMGEEEEYEYAEKGADMADWDEGVDDDTELLLPEPYDGAYVHWLCAKIDLALGETDRYTNEAQQYNNDLQQFAAQMRRTHRPRAGAKFRY